MLDDLATVAPRATNTELRTILGCFLFGEDDVFKPIGVLCGGERNRYALARMLMVPSNFMLLDEPTNHLDMRAKDVLLTALQKYNGTVVFVSHDRYFIDKLATRVIEVENGRCTLARQLRRLHVAEAGRCGATGVGGIKHGEAPAAPRLCRRARSQPRRHRRRTAMVTLPRGPVSIRSSSAK